MNAIEQHIENMFKDLPETKEIKRIKNDLFLNAMDRYEELIDSGKTENEALGTIIIEMGERDVLLEELAYDQEKDLQDYSLNSLEDARFFIEANDIESSKIGLGVLMILVGVGLIPTLETFGVVLIGVILLLVLVALAVGLFITSGLRLESIEHDLYDVNQKFFMTD